MSNPVQCLNCQNYTLTTSGLRGHGLGNCNKGPKWEFPSPVVDRKCDKYAQSNEAEILTRIRWWQGKSGNRHK